MQSACRSMEGLELVSLDRRLVLVQMSKWVLRSVVMRVVVCINCLGFQSRDRVEFFDCCSTQSRKCPENSTLDFCNLSVLHSIHQGVLRLRGVILQLFCCVLFAERSNFIE